MMATGKDKSNTGGPQRRPSERVRKRAVPSESSPDSGRMALSPLHQGLVEYARLVQALEVHQAELETQNEELRNARQELETALSRYIELFDFAPIGFVTVSAEEVIQEINHTAANLFGRERSRLVNSKILNHLPHSDRIALSELLKCVLFSDSIGYREVGVVRGDGTVIRVAVNATHLIRPAPLALLVFEDVTEQRARQERLECAERALRIANQRKDEFLGALSHELRNPLAPIHYGLSVLEQTPAGSEAALRTQEIMARQVSHLTRLVDDLLDVTRIARGKVLLQLERTDLSGLARRTLEDYRSSFEANGVNLCGHIATEIWVEADPARLVQAISNLLANALKFTPFGERVQVTLSGFGEHATLEIRDTGVGIAPEVLPHLFEAFSQAPQTIDRTRGGLGLGLAVVKGVVELHGGSVNIASEGEGRGTTFKLTLPQADGPVTPHTGNPLEAARRHRILIVEDNLDAAETLAALLLMKGHEVLIANDGESALELARECLPDIVLCDLGLPKMNGFDVARQLRGTPALSSLFLIALSGYALPEDIERSKQAGFDRHLAKPAKLETLDQVFAGVPTRSAEIAKTLA